VQNGNCILHPGKITSGSVRKSSSGNISDRELQVKITGKHISASKVRNFLTPRATYKRRGLNSRVAETLYNQGRAGHPVAAYEWRKIFLFNLEFISSTQNL
jgi:hypothetical protein